MKEIVNTNQAPAAIGPYAQAVAIDGLVITSGQLPIDPATLKASPSRPVSPSPM